MGRSESEKAIQDLDKAIELAPAWAELYDSRAWCHRNERRFGKAWADIGKAIELAPDYPQAIFSRAFFHMDAERFEEALADWAELTEKFPWAWEASWQQAITLLRLGREEEALAVAERAIENSREVEWVHTRLGLILNAIGRVDEAQGFDRSQNRSGTRAR
jgi:tetratricopeptide (TPR) repeat protein